ncbi:hypothetical protein ACH4LK_22580 [Streptomyces lydicus]
MLADLASLLLVLLIALTTSTLTTPPDRHRLTGRPKETERR